jgi:hypothetical protein
MSAKEIPIKSTGLELDKVPAYLNIITALRKPTNNPKKATTTFHI